MFHHLNGCLGASNAIVTAYFEVNLIKTKTEVCHVRPGSVRSLCLYPALRLMHSTARLEEKRHVALSLKS